MLTDALKTTVMKIVQINNVYDFGSTGRITRDIHHGLLEKGYESAVYYGRRLKTDDSGVHKICSELYGKAQNGLYRITGIKYGGCFFSTNRLIKALEAEKPDIVHLHCLNGHFINVYRLLAYLKNRGVPTVLTLHAEFMYTGGCSHALDCCGWRDDAGCKSVKCPLYGKELKSLTGDKSSVMWEKMRDAFDGFDKIAVVSVSPWLTDRAKTSAILKDKRHLVIYNGLDTDVFHEYPKESLLKLRRELGFNAEEKIVFHATPHFDSNPANIKGGYYLLALAEKMKSYRFLVAGKYDSSLNVPDNVMLLGDVPDKTKMAMLYSMSDVIVLTSKRETFSMVCAESLCCGTPVVGFMSGAPEMISISRYSDFCEYGDTDRLAALVQNRAEREKDPNISLEAAEIYNKERMVEKYISTYCSLMQR